MSRDKQIEEMAEIISSSVCIGVLCSDCEFEGKPGCFMHHKASSIYNAGYRKIPDNIGEFSDGYHTFNELYHHRAILFSVICNSMPDKAWKSKLHDTCDMFDGMFIVGIETPEGQATYHYDIEPYWDMFKVKELEKAPKWDGHTPQVAIDRISKISDDVVEVRHGHWKYLWLDAVCSECGYINEADAVTRCRSDPPYCPKCGAKMDGERREK